MAERFDQYTNPAYTSGMPDAHVTKVWVDGQPFVREVRDKLSPMQWAAAVFGTKYVLHCRHVAVGLNYPSVACGLECIA